MYQGITPTPDSAFVRHLHEFDPDLVCVFSRRHHRFVIQKPLVTGPPAEVWMVVDELGGFRQPDNRELRALFGGDLRRVPPEERMRRADEYTERYEAKQRKDVEDDIRDATKDDKLQLMNTMAKAFNVGKGNSTFRRIECKPKEYRVVDNRKVH